MQSLLPILLILACPLMMIFMMRGMHGGHGRSTGWGAHRPSGHDGHVTEVGAAEWASLREDLQMRIDELDARLEALERAEEGTAAERGKGRTPVRV